MAHRVDRMQERPTSTSPPAIDKESIVGVGTRNRLAVHARAPTLGAGIRRKQPLCLVRRSSHEITVGFHRGGAPFELGSIITESLQEPQRGVTGTDLLTQGGTRSEELKCHGQSALARCQQSMVLIQHPTAPEVPRTHLHHMAGLDEAYKSVEQRPKVLCAHCRGVCRAARSKEVVAKHTATRSAWAGRESQQDELVAMVTRNTCTSRTYFVSKAPLRAARRLSAVAKRIRAVRRWGVAGSTEFAQHGVHARWSIAGELADLRESILCECLAVELQKPKLTEELFYRAAGHVNSPARQRTGRRPTQVSTIPWAGGPRRAPRADAKNRDNFREFRPWPIALRCSRVQHRHGRLAAPANSER
eukprot:scaffold6910_cov136-Isochrysis_galbana.AAC.11